MYVLISSGWISMWIRHGKHILFNYDKLYFNNWYFLIQKQSEIMFFLLFVIVMRARKTGSVTMLAYLSTGFMYCKVASLILWFNADPRYGLVFLVLFVCKLTYQVLQTISTALIIFSYTSASHLVSRTIIYWSGKGCLLQCNIVGRRVK